MARTRKTTRTKSFNDMSSRELFALAERRKQQEAESARAAAAEKIEALRQQKREITTEYRRAMRALDGEIRRLGGLGGRKKAATGSRRSGLSSAILDIIGKKGKATTTEIKSALGRRGIDAANLSQTMAYLKRSGRITSPGRATYALA